MPVEFEQKNDFNKSFRVQQESSSGSSMTDFLIKKGWVKDINQANIFLIGTIVVSVLLTIFVIYRFVFGGSIIPKAINPNTKVIQEYVRQGYTGDALFNKIMEARKSGLIK